MKSTFILLIFFSYANLFSQTSIFKLYSKNQCDQKVEKIEFFSLIKDGIEFKSDSGQIVLTEAGTYTLKYILDWDTDASKTRTYKVDLMQNLSDTLKKFRVEELVDFNGINNTFYCCGKECDGKVQEYFENGNLRLIGFFKKGRHIRKFKEYYENGNLKEFRSYYSNGKLKRLKEYDEEGKLTGDIKPSKRHSS